jgi:hypothetical protein
MTLKLFHKINTKIRWDSKLIILTSSLTKKSLSKNFKNEIIFSHHS